MAGVTSRPSRNAGAEGTPPALTVADPSTVAGQSGTPVALDSHGPASLKTFLTGPEPRWARPLLMLGVVGALMASVVAAILLLTQGIEPRAFDQHTSDSSTEKLTASRVAQSFRSPRNNLSRVDIGGGFIGAVPEDGVARLVLGEGPGGKTLYQVSLSSIVDTGGYALSFGFPAISHSEGVTYTVVFETPNRPLGGTASLQYDSFDSLTSGTMYLDNAAQTGDLAFAPRYRYDLSTLVSDLANSVTRDGWLTLCWLLLLLVPGLTMLVWLPNRLNAGQRFLAAPCLSALMLPVFYLILRALGLHIGDVALWVIMFVCAGLLFYKWFMVQSLRSKVSAPGAATQSSLFAIRNLQSADLAFWGLFAGVMLVTLVSRLLSLRDAFGGAGLDAYPIKCVEVV